MVTNNSPSRGKMSPRSTIWRQAKRSRMGDLCPSAPSAIFTTMARVLRSATSAIRRAMGQIPKGTVVLNVELHDISREILQSLRIRMGKWECIRLGICSWECREERECIEGLGLQCRHRLKSTWQKDVRSFGINIRQERGGQVRGKAT
ncbi:hypothetical protein Tco_1509458 [Tanacetum coccineum]